MNDPTSPPPCEVWPLPIDTSGSQVQPASLEPFPLEVLIAEAVELHMTLSQQRYPLARHHARIVWVRAGRASLPQIQTAAADLMTALDGAMRPDVSKWKAPLAALNVAIDQALSESPFVDGS